MKGEKFLLYSNRNTNKHIFTYVSPDGEVSTIDSDTLTEAFDDSWKWKLSGHHAIVRVAHNDVINQDSWDELLRIPWMKANEVWDKDEPPPWASCE